MNKHALFLLVDGFEEIEAVTPVDLLRRAGVDVVTAALGGTRQVSGRCGVMMVADALLDEVDAESFDVLVIPGGPGVAVLRADGRPAELARRYADAGKPVAAICAAPLVLKDAGLLEGRKFTAHFSTHEELPGADAGTAVVVDAGVITSRGAGTAMEFGLALIERIFGRERAGEIAASIMC